MDNMQNEKSSRPIESLMQTAMQSIKEMVDVNTVVGDAVETKDGTVIIPISQVGCGFAAGGGEYEFTGGSTRLQDLPFAGGSGAGVSVKPLGFLLVQQNDARLISVFGNRMAERLVDIAPQLMDRLETLLTKKSGSAPYSG